VSHGSEHGHGEGWFDLSPEERLTEYGRRKAHLEKILTAVRIHRTEDCIGAPLCPGREASDLLARVPSSQLGDFVSTVLAALADDRQEIENLRAERDRLRDKLRTAEQGREAAQREADAGWDAYRQERRAAEPRA
jgi:hypothetical protein